MKGKLQCRLCDKKHWSRGLCEAHYRKYMRYGDPLYAAQSSKQIPLVCSKCRVELTDNNWRPSDKRMGHYQCRTCKNIYDRSYFPRAAWNKRLKVIKNYGGKCFCCGESHPYFLTIDHVNNDGSKERKILRGSRQIIDKIIRENYPPNYQILCFNCNAAKQYRRICPHNTG